MSTDATSAVTGVWLQLAQCESGNNPSANTGNGYYGMYQFSLVTWRSVGGSGYPHQASAAEQTMRAQMLQARSGWGQWGACSAGLGLY
nr:MULTISPECIES: transglycosylase family protein [unclassified Actinomyces]